MVALVLLSCAEPKPGDPPADGDATAGDADTDTDADTDADADADSDADTDGDTVPDDPPGGFLEQASDVGDIGRLVDAAFVATLPAAGSAFTFPAPYGTEAVRLTDDATCGGQDCVRYVGYSYWRNIDQHEDRG